jgi:enamine deaminase RidA (YjgF/YER057c/UK114 family)
LLVEQRLEEMGLVASPPVLRTNRVAALQHGDLVYLSGRIPTYPDGSSITGKVGGDLTWEQGYEAARQTAVNLLGELKEFIGDLDRVTQVLKLLCMVNTADDFYDTSGVCDGASDLLHELYGERGRHTRSAVGIACPAGNMAIEIEMVVVVK